MAAEMSKVEKDVTEWLNTQGYPLEFRTAKALEDARMTVTISDYIDSAEGVRREIDVTGFNAIGGGSDDEGFEITAHVHVVVECKHGVAPWVLLGSSAELASVWRVFATPATEEMQTRLTDSQAVRALARTWHFGAKDPLSHSVVEVRKSGNKDNAFDSLQKIAHAAWDCLSKSEGELELAFPCIVVDGPLLVACHDTSTGVVSAKEVELGRILWHGSRAGTLVDIVRATSIEAHAKRLAHTIKRMEKALSGSPKG